jgi:hypothetical protein
MYSLFSCLKFLTTGDPTFFGKERKMMPVYQNVCACGGLSMYSLITSSDETPLTLSPDVDEKNSTFV